MYRPGFAAALCVLASAGHAQVSNTFDPALGLQSTPTTLPADNDGLDGAGLVGQEASVVFDGKLYVGGTSALVPQAPYISGSRSIVALDPLTNSWINGFAGDPELRFDSEVFELESLDTGHGAWLVVRGFFSQVEDDSTAPPTLLAQIGSSDAPNLLIYDGASWSAVPGTGLPAGAVFFETDAIEVRTDTSPNRLIASFEVFLGGTIDPCNNAYAFVAGYDPATQTWTPLGGRWTGRVTDLLYSPVRIGSPSVADPHIYASSSLASILCTTSTPIAFAEFDLDAAGDWVNLADSADCRFDDIIDINVIDWTLHEWGVSDTRIVMSIVDTFELGGDCPISGGIASWGGFWSWDGTRFRPLAGQPSVSDPGVISDGVGVGALAVHSWDDGNGPVIYASFANAGTIAPLTLQPTTTMSRYDTSTGTWGEFDGNGPSVTVGAPQELIDVCGYLYLLGGNFRVALDNGSSSGPGSARGSVARFGPECGADYASPLDPTRPDGVLTGADLFAWQDRFGDSDVGFADIAGPVRPQAPDGVLTGADFFRFLDLFNTGQPCAQCP